MTGGQGSDRFVFNPGDGNMALNLADVITDFDTVNDIIDLSGFGISDFGTEINLTQQGSNVAVQSDVSGEYIVILNNVLLGDIDQSHFVTM